MPLPDSTPTRPYLIRALYEWCTDNGFTPYLAVLADETTQVPREYVKNGEIVLNVSFDATSSLKLGNEFIEFKARFAGSARDILIPIDRVLAIYARENGQGMAFPTPGRDTPGQAEPLPGPGSLQAGAGEAGGSASNRPIPLVPVSGGIPGNESDPPRPPGRPRGRPSLKRVK